MYPRKDKGVTDVEVYEERPVLWQPPKFKSMLVIGGEDGFKINMTAKCPNWWHRFWQRVFCGFEWSKLSD